MHHIFTLVRFDVLDSALRAPIVAATTPNVGPFLTVLGAAIIIDELPFGHFFVLLSALAVA
jgi:hypothetical protein